MNLSSTALRDHILHEIEDGSKADPKSRCRNEDVSIQLNLFGVEHSARGEDTRGEVSGIGIGTIRWDTPSKVEVSPHVEEGERKAEEEGLEEVAALPIPSPIPHLLPYPLQLNALLCVRHLKS